MTDHTTDLPPVKVRRAKLEATRDALRADAYDCEIELGVFQAQHPGAKPKDKITFPLPDGRVAQTVFGDRIRGLKTRAEEARRGARWAQAQLDALPEDEPDESGDDAVDIGDLAEDEGEA